MYSQIELWNTWVIALFTARKFELIEILYKNYCINHKKLKVAIATKVLLCSS